jgi:uncharacterized glyoxalase superfamily protein PhnB
MISQVFYFHFMTDNRNTLLDSLTPNFFVRNIQETIDFYKLLGFHVTMSVPDEGDCVWCMMTNGNVHVMFQIYESPGGELPQINRTNGGSLLLYIKMNNISNFYESVKDKVTVIKIPEKTFYGTTEFTIIDNNNFLLTFAADDEQ